MCGARCRSHGSGASAPSAANPAAVCPPGSLCTAAGPLPKRRISDIPLPASLFALAPLPRRCLYEIGFTPNDKLQIITTGFRKKDLSSTFKMIDVSKAGCFDMSARNYIVSSITLQHGSLDEFTKLLRLRLLLRPLRFDGDIQARHTTMGAPMRDSLSKLTPPAAFPRFSASAGYPPQGRRRWSGGHRGSERTHQRAGPGERVQLRARRCTARAGETLLCGSWVVTAALGWVRRSAAG